jgi:hypothetical protein
LAVLILVLGPVSATGTEKPKTETPDSAVIADQANIVEKLIFDWPKGEKWSAMNAHQGSSSSIQLFVPEGQSTTSWEEMASLEIVYGQKTTNLAGMARMTFLGTQKGSPNATWDIIEKGFSEQKHPYILYQINCPDFVTKEPPQVQLWKLTLGKTALFNLQYSYKGKEMPSDRKEKILEMLKKAYIKAESKE